MVGDDEAGGAYYTCNKKSNGYIRAVIHIGHKAKKDKIGGYQANSHSMHADLAISIKDQTHCRCKEYTHCKHDYLLWEILIPEYIPNPEIEYLCDHIGNNPILPCM